MDFKYIWGIYVFYNCVIVYLTHYLYRHTQGETKTETEKYMLLNELTH